MPSDFLPGDQPSHPAAESFITFPAAQNHPRMPPEIAKAIIAVKKKVRQLGKDDENKFARFKYVSVDKFYDAVGRIMADAGIFVVTDERSIVAETRETTSEQGQVKKAVWLTAVYELTVFHESGAEYGPIHRTIMVPATGPQAFGSGMSYVEKYFLRGLFKIPTGDEDADAEPQQGLPHKMDRADSSVLPSDTEERAVADREREAREKYYAIRKLVKDAKSVDEIDEIVSSHNADLSSIKAVSEAGSNALKEIVEVCKGELRKQARNEHPVP